ncbi:MAG: MBL fold metallo-hydrolase [Pseudonocardiaceae bacterium]|nr:MBL fold metallo-hydrolase [Pseudonocardiaceae bacterium]
MTRLYVLTCGWAEIDVDTYMPMEPERGPTYMSPITAFLITGPKNTLVDTGIAIEHVTDPWSRTGGPAMTVRMRQEDGIVPRLAEVGLRPNDIDLVITTHFDCDHCGGHRYFPKARHVVQREQLAFAANTPDRCPAADWSDCGIEYEALDGDTELLPWIRVVATPGHVPGHQSVMVELPESGPVILVGDAAVSETMFESERVNGTHDPAASVASIRRLKGIRAERGAETIFSHDAEAWRTRYRIAPRFYS